MPQGVAVNSDSNRIYVTGGGTNDSLYVIDGSGVSVVVDDVIWVGNFPSGVCVNPLTNRIYVTRFTGASVSVVDGSKDSVITNIGVGNDPTGICVNPLTNRIYVANAGSHSVSVIDGVSNTVVDSINVGVEPRRICVNPATNKIYVSCFFGGKLCVLEDLTGGIEVSPPSPSSLNFSVSPNPFSSGTEIVLNVPDGAGDVSFSIYNVAGTLVKSFSLGSGNSLSITLRWDGKGDNGKKCVSGVYIGVLKAGESKPSQGKILLVN
jgi:YVTN family beta-propeller protein